MKDKNEELQQQQQQDEQDVLGRLLKMSGGRPAVPEDVTERVKMAVQEHWQNTVRARSRRRFVVSLSAGIAALFCLYLIGWQFLANQPPEAVAVGIVENIVGNVVLLNSDQNTASSVQRGGVLLSGSSLETADSGRLLVRLLHGVSLRLDVSTKLRLDSQSSVVLEKGAVYLDCARSANAISVVTPLGTVTDQGTQFEVRVADADMRISVREGLVLLEQQESKRSVPAGKQLTINHNGMASLGDISAHGAQWKWVSEVAPSYNLEGRSLMEFLTWVTRENGWSLQFSEQRIQAAAPKIILHGSVVGLSPDQMPGAVIPVCGLSYTLNDGVLTVKPGQRI